jgi:hypothetical protein
MVESKSKSGKLECNRQAKGRVVQSRCPEGGVYASNIRRGGKGQLRIASAD